MSDPDYSWIRVKRWNDDPSLTWEERFKSLLRHHEQETNFLIAVCDDLREDKDLLMEEWETQYLDAIGKLRAVLGSIRTWDMLNPPKDAPEPLSDGPFFRKIIDEVLTQTIIHTPLRSVEPAKGEINETVVCEDGQMGLIQASWVENRVIPDRRCSLLTATGTRLELLSKLRSAYPEK